MASGGFVEPKTRVTLFLPVNDANEVLAVYDVIRFLQSQREQEVGRVTGYTYSHFAPGVFTGGWWDDSDWVEDRITQLIVDYKESHQSQRFAEAIQRLHDKIAEAYRTRGRKQDAFWIIAHDAVLFMTAGT